MLTQGSRTATGYSYAVFVHLRETAGLGATITTINLTLFNASTAFGATQFVNPLNGQSSQISPNSTADSKQLIMTDDIAGHPLATRVEALVGFIDNNQNAGNVRGTTDVPALNPAPEPPQSVTFNLTGTIKDSSNSRSLSAADVSVVEGINAGKSSGTNASGAYSISGLVASSFTVRVTKGGYQTTDVLVTVQTDTHFDISISPNP